MTLPVRLPLKDSSVRTLLRRLEARGYLTHHLDGKIFVYEAAIPASVSRPARTADHQPLLVGLGEQFLVGMVDEKVLSATRFGAWRVA